MSNSKAPLFIPQLQLDSDGGCSVFRDVLPPSSLAALLEEVIMLDDSEYEAPDDPRAFTSGSYWCPVNEPDFEPRNLVEKYICGLAGLDSFRQAVDVSQMAGAEWWIQVPVCSLSGSLSGSLSACLSQWLSQWLSQCLSQ